MNFAKHIYKTMAVRVFFVISGFGLIHQVVAADTMQFQRIDPNKVPNELAMLADTARYNYEKMRTWEGKLLSESTSMYRGMYAANVLKERRIATKSAKEPNELAMINERIIEFKIDLKNNRLRTHITRTKPIEYIDAEKGLTYTASYSLFDQTTITDSENEIRCYPNRWKGDNTVSGRIAKKRPVTKMSKYPFSDSDPRSFYSIGTPAWVLLSQLSESMKLLDSRTFGVVLEKAETAKGTIYRVQTSMPGVSQPFEKFVLDGGKGFNPTYIEVKNDKGALISEITTDYVEIQGIFVPSKHRLLRYDPDGCLHEEVTSTLSDMQVNTTLPENTFSLNNLGLRDGDSYVDEIANKKYLYKEGGTLVEQPNGK